MRKSNCCKAELLPRTVLCSKCLSEVKIEKLTAKDFIEDNVFNLPFKETLSEVRSVACNSPRFNKTLIIKFELDKDGMYKYNLPEDMDKVRVEQRASYVVKYGKHVNKIKSLDEVKLTFFIRNNQVVIDSYEFTKLKKSDLVLTFLYAKKNVVHSEKNNVCDREKSLKSFIYNLNIAGIENISKDRNKILKSNLDFLQLLSYANMNLHVTKFMDLGNDEVHVEFGRGFLPSNRPSVFTFITKWEYLDQILIKKMVVPISPVPISKGSLDNLPFPIKIGDKVLFQNSHALLKYFNIGYHVLNGTFDNKYIIQNIYKTEDLFVITISDNYDLYKSHPLSHVDIFTLFGSDNALGVIVNPDQKYGRKVTPVSPVQKKTWRKTPSILRNDGSTILKLFDFVNVLGDDVAYETIFEDSKDCVKIVAMINEKEKLRVLDISTTGNEFVLRLGSGNIYVSSKPLRLEEVEKYFVFNSESPNGSIPSPFEHINVNPGWFLESGQIPKENMKSTYNLDGMSYLKVMSRPNFETNAVNDNNSIMVISKLVPDDGTLKTVVELGNSVTVNKDIFYRSLFMYPDGKIDEIFNNTRTFKVTDIRTNGRGYVLTLTNGDISLVTVVLSIDDIEKFFTVRKGRGFTPGFTYADESGFFKTDNTEDKKFDEPIKDEKIIPARIDKPNLFSIGDYVTLKEKTIKEGIAKGFIKNPLGSIFKGDKCFKIVNTSLDTLTAEHTFVFVADDTPFGFTIEADKVNEVIIKIPLTDTICDTTEKKDNVLSPKEKEDYIHSTLSKYPVNSELFICKKNFDVGLAEGYITNNFGMNMEYSIVLEISEVSVDAESKKITFTLKKGDSACGFTIEADKAKDVIQKLYTGEDEPNINTPLKTKKTRTKKGETKK